MRYVSTLLVLFVISTIAAIAQCAPSPSRDSEDEVRRLIVQLRQASKTGDAKLYTADFDNNASWEGPAGESALGPANIQRAMELVLRKLGPLQFADSTIHTLSATLLLVDMHQITANARSEASVTTAPGSIAAKGNVRTTLLLRKFEGGWKVTFARIALLRGEVINNVSQNK